MMRSHFRKVLGAVTAAMAITSTGIAPAQAVAPEPTPVGSKSSCQDVVVLGAEGSGQTYADNNGFGPEAWLGLTAYAERMEGYKVGYFTVPYPSAPADIVSLMTAKYRKTFFDSIDQGVEATLKFLAQREPACRDAGEHYVLMGYSQGAMVMHRVLWQLAQPKTKYSALAAQLLPRLDGVLAIGDGDRAGNQGGTSYDTAPARGSGIWWAGARMGATSAKYKPVDAPIPDLSNWPAARFHSVCHAGDFISDYNPLSPVSPGLRIHQIYGPEGDSGVYVRSAATNIAKTSKALNPKGTTLAPVPVRVGHTGTVMLAPDGNDVASVQWLSSPIPNAALSPGQPTIPATLTWSASAADVVDYSVRVDFTDGTSKDVAGSMQAFSVPAPSLSVVNLQTTYSEASTANYPSSTVTFGVVKAGPSDTTPQKSFSDREDPASDWYNYLGGDANGDDVLDVGETWSYGAELDWGPWEPDTVRTRTVLVQANDTTGAGAWTELEVPVTLTR